MPQFIYNKIQQKFSFLTSSLLKKQPTPCTGMQTACNNKEADLG